MIYKRDPVNGRILSEPTEVRFWRHVDKTGECWVWTGIKYRNGYGIARHKGRPRLAHRVAWEIATGAWPSGMLLHSCDNRACVNVAHLRIGTAKENIADMHMRGRANTVSSPGEKNGSAKLRYAQVAEIRRLHAAGEHTNAEIASRFGVSLPLIEKIVGGRLWRYPEAGWHG